MTKDIWLGTPRKGSKKVTCPLWERRGSGPENNSQSNNPYWTEGRNWSAVFPFQCSLTDHWHPFWGYLVSMYTFTAVFLVPFSLLKSFLKGNLCHLSFCLSSPLYVTDNITRREIPVTTETRQLVCNLKLINDVSTLDAEEMMYRRNANTLTGICESTEKKCRKMPNSRILK